MPFPNFCSYTGVKTTLQQLIWHGDTADSVNISIILDVPIPFCGVNYHCHFVPRVKIVLGDQCSAWPPAHLSQMGKIMFQMGKNYVNTI